MFLSLYSESCPIAGKLQLTILMLASFSQCTVSHLKSFFTHVISSASHNIAVPLSILGDLLPAVLPVLILQIFRLHFLQGVFHLKVTIYVRYRSGEEWQKHSFAQFFPRGSLSLLLLAYSFPLGTFRSVCWRRLSRAIGVICFSRFSSLCSSARSFRLVSLRSVPPRMLIAFPYLFV